MNQNVPNRIALITLLFGIASGLAACSAETGNAPLSSDLGVDSQEFSLTAEQQVNAYGTALLTRDAALLDQLLSTEVKERLAGYDGGIERFIEKQRKTLLQAFPELEEAGVAGAFKVTKVSAQEGVVSVSFAYNGKELNRPFYFVREGEVYRLNVARPGFSKPLASGALPNDSYQISADSDAQYQTVSCYRGGSANVQPAYYIGKYNNYYVSCPNVCGFWHGASFGSSGSWLGTPYCDYNTWGTDVWVGFWGAQCNDSC